MQGMGNDAMMALQSLGGMDDWNSVMGKKNCIWKSQYGKDVCNNKRASASGEMNVEELIGWVGEKPDTGI